MGMKGTEHAQEEARAQLDSIGEMVKALEAGEEIDGQDPQERIYEHPLSVEVRTGWHCVEDRKKATEYNILLCTGGPAVRIIGELNEYGEPVSAKLEYQDWFTPWARYGSTTEEEEGMLLTYASQFHYFVD